MKRANRRYCIIFGFIALLGFFVCTPLEVSATLVWSETFDELDHEAWTTLLSCRLEDGALRGVDGNHISAVRAYRPSNISVGTWMFDLTECSSFDEELDICKIFFMSPGVPTFCDYYAFSIVHAGGEEGARYSYTLEKFTNSLPKAILDTQISEARPTFIGVLQHFAITRSNDGQMSVYLNSSLILQAVDTDLNSTEYFGFYTWDDWAFDNVMVYDTIEIGSDYAPIVIGVASVAVIATVALVFWRRR